MELVWLHRQVFGASCILLESMRILSKEEGNALSTCLHVVHSLIEASVATPVCAYHVQIAWQLKQSISRLQCTEKHAGLMYLCSCCWNTAVSCCAADGSPCNM